MRNRTLSIILAIFLLVSANSKADAEQTDSVLQIYLPREITIESDIPNLGQVAVIRGEESLAAKAGKVVLGRISSPGQKIIVDRSIVLSRLACSGIPASEVTLTGAEKMTIRQQHQIIRGSEFVEAASAFLKENLSDDSVCRFDAVSIPKDLIVPDVSKDIKLSCRLVKNDMTNQSRVRVAACCDNKETGVREVTFGLKYNCHRLVAQVDISQGAVISSENVKVEKAVASYPEPAGWIAPYGLVAKRLLRANTEIRPDMVGPAELPVLLKCDQSVVIKVEKLGLLITAIGKTMQDGRVDEYIKVRNVDSQRIILAKVNEDGSVEPVF